ncbi:MAG: EAL domain-containing protein [Thermodesulfobacterium sp.]|nr:EAL domain-containing protein [Thermodesulfobacterium sp.]
MLELYKQFYHLIKTSESLVNIVFISESHLLREMLKQTFKQRGFVFSEDSYFLFLSKVNFLKVLNTLKEDLSLSTPALDDIQLIVIPEEESFSIKHLPNLKPLSAWYSLLEVMEDLKVIIDESLTVYFQPVIDREMNIVGHECLIRGLRPDGSLISPYSLFELAMKTGNIFNFDRLCRETCVKAVAKANLRDKLIFINFIPTSVYDPATCLQTTISLVYSLGLQPDKFIFEVVESQKVKDLKHLSEVLNTYREGGFKVALDDIGTGYASLELLVTLKPDFIKIDKEIVREVHKDSLKKSLVKALVQISQENNIKVLAEGVENKEDFEYLRDKVDYFQGFYFSKPQAEPLKKLNLN